MSIEHLPIKKTIVERFHLKPSEGALIAALLGFLNIVVETEGTPADPKIFPVVILAGFFHTSHLDTAVVAHAAKNEGRKNIYPVTKGDYWKRRGYNLLLRLFFGNHFHMTKSTKAQGQEQTASFLETFHQKIKATQEQHTVIIFPEGGRNKSLGRVHQGAFVASVDAFENLKLSVPVQPTEIRNMPDVLTKGNLSAKELSALLGDSIKNIFIGKKHVVKVVFHEPISPDILAAEIEYQSSRELVGAMKKAYVDVVNQRTSIT